MCTKYLFLQPPPPPRHLPLFVAQVFADGHAGDTLEVLRTSGIARRRWFFLVEKHLGNRQTRRVALVHPDKKVTLYCCTLDYSTLRHDVWPWSTLVE